MCIIAENTGFNFQDMEKFLNSLAKMVLNHIPVLDYILAKEGGVCTMANDSCCTYIKTSGKVEQRAKLIQGQTKWPRDNASLKMLYAQLQEEIKR